MTVRARVSEGLPNFWQVPHHHAMQRLTLLSMRIKANSAQTVLPLPVGAATSTFSSLLYSVWKVWVWIGLKLLKRWYSLSN